MDRKRKKITAVPVLIAVAVLLFGAILMIEKPELISAPETAPVYLEGGSGDYFMPSDPDKQVAVFTKLYEMYGESDPKKLESYPVNWQFARGVEEQEKELRLKFVQTAEEWLGANEADGSHQQVVDIYNSHTPLARDYLATYEDSWCSIFVSTNAIQCGLTDIIPTECGCEPHIELFQQLGRWEEADDYVPLPGDIVFYHWECQDEGDCRGYPDHVGIVVGTLGNFIQVIEGNYGDAVSYHTIWVDYSEIRGYGLPNYEAAV